MDDWETKLPAIVADCIEENLTSMAGVPSWMLVLLNKVLEKTNKTHLFEIWPNLEVYFHGGVSFEPYIDQYTKLLPSNRFKFYEIYNASEGFFAVQDRNDSKDLLLMLNYGIFYEFIPMETYGTPQQKIIPLSEVEVGKNYAIVITTNAGLWRYMIGDTVRFTATNPYRIRVSGRTKHHINVFGEELIIENADEALRQVCLSTGAEIADYTAGPVFMEGKEKGKHQWIIEFKTPPPCLQDFTQQLDQNLQKLNSDYEAKRYLNMTLNAPEVHSARRQLFYDWLKKEGKLGGQHKIPRLSNNRDYLEELLKMNTPTAV